jgi:hypothetical protein
MKKITKTTKAPAPATKTAAPAPALKPSAAPKIKKTAAPSEEPSVVVKPKGAKVTITAKIDIRGDGAGLSWEKGKPLGSTAGDTWTIVLPWVEKSFEFKLLINDLTWSADPNFEAGPGDTVTVTPVF